jgi:hypothetical protein
VARQVPKERIHVSLQVLQNPYREFKHRPAPLETYQALHGSLRRLGYSTSISTVSDDNVTMPSCGKRAPAILAAYQGIRGGHASAALPVV